MVHFVCFCGATTQNVDLISKLHWQLQLTSFHQTGMLPISSYKTVRNRWDANMMGTIMGGPHSKWYESYNK